MFDRFILMALTPMTLVGGTLGWTSLAGHEPMLATSGGGVATAAIAGSDEPAGTRHLVRDADGLFYAEVALNGRPVRAIIDTGATKSVLSTADADAIAGIRVSRRTLGTMRTLNGEQRYRAAIVDRTTIGSQDVGQVEFALLDGNASISVIGQDVLRQLGPIILDGDRLTLR